MKTPRPSSPSFRRPEKWNSVPVPVRVAERAAARVDKQPDGCWISQYSIASHGYSQIGWQTGGKRHVVLGHRAAWVFANGQVPLGMTIDHLCKTRRCVNPEHLRLLPNYENARRIDGRDWPMGECANGHSTEFTISVPSSAMNKRGERRASNRCSKCWTLYQARWNWKVRHPNESMPDSLLLSTERNAT